MTEEEYEELLERIKFDLYKEFIDPETACLLYTSPSPRD